MRLNGIIGAEIPYYKMMNKAMPGPAKDTKRKPKNGRLTEIDPKTNKPRLKSGVPISRAVEVLYMFENTDVLPYQIEEMKVTISNLQTRVKKLEEFLCSINQRKKKNHFSHFSRFNNIVWQFSNLSRQLLSQRRCGKIYDQFIGSHDQKI